MIERVASALIPVRDLFHPLRFIAGGALLLLTLTRCHNSNSRPVRLSDIPRPPGLEVYEGVRKETTIDSLITTISLSTPHRPPPQEMQINLLLKEVQWDQVHTFYQKELASGGWKEVPNDGRHPSKGFAKWTRNSSAGEQVFVVSRIPFSACEGQPGEDVLLMVLSPRYE